MTDRTCNTCRWWKGGRIDPYPAFGVDDAAQGICQRRAPVVIGGLYGPESTVWPSTKIDDRCGEWEPKP